MPNTSTPAQNTHEHSNGTPARLALGIDIGGTGIKAGAVDLQRGRLEGERLRVATPKPATIDSLCAAIGELIAPIVDGLAADAPVGVAFPAVVRRGVVLSAVNVADEWMYADLGQVFGEAFDREVWALNDSDAAGLAESRYGAGRHHRGTAVTVTLGTGVGTALVVDGVLVPNVELGCLSVRGKPAGQRIANSVREQKKLTWKQWASDLELFVAALDEAVAPDLVIIGGGVSSKAHEYVTRIRSRPIVVPARLRNDAGIVGAACFAAQQMALRADGSTARVSELVPASQAEVPATSDTEASDVPPAA